MSGRAMAAGLLSLAVYLWCFHTVDLDKHCIDTQGPQTELCIELGYK